MLAPPLLASTRCRRLALHAANGLPVNPSVPSTDPGSTGIKQLGVYGCYISGNSVIIAPAQGTYGNMGKGIFTGQPFQIADFSLRKDTKIERIGFQFRFDIFNVTNHPEYAIPGGYGNGSTNAIQTPSGFGRSTCDTEREQRERGSRSRRCAPVSVRLEAHLLTHQLQRGISGAGPNGSGAAVPPGGTTTVLSVDDSRGIALLLSRRFGECNRCATMFAQ